MIRILSVLSLFAVAGLVNAQDAVKGITVDKEKKTVSIDAKVAPRKLARLDQIYPIEVVAAWGDEKKGAKAHETVVTIDVNPSDVHKALESLGIKPGKPVRGGEVKCEGPELTVYIEIDDNGTAKRLGMNKILLDPKTKKPFPNYVTFHFTGSVQTKPDPNKDDTKYGADLTGTLIAVYPVTDETVCQSSLTMKEEKFLKLEVNKDALPKEGTAVKLVLVVK